VQNPQPLVAITKLSKIYHQGETEVRALDSVSLDINPYEFLTLMGPSGSGKSTLLHIMAGIDRPTSGECRVGDVVVTELDDSELADWRNQNVGFVFQSFNLIPVLTAYENVELPLLLMSLGSAQR
jgi:putative ABC transport system ATP-binding protein